MPLTPADVANKQFKISFRGYSLDEVDSFLDEVEGELGRLLRENAELRSSPTAAPQAPVYAAPPVGAPPLPGEGQEAALRTLLLAQRTADEAVREAQAEASTIVASAQARAANVDNEIAMRISVAMGGVDERKRELEKTIEDLQAFEREYRTRLKAYLESQLQDLAGRGAPDDAGAGVPAAARSAAITGSSPTPAATPARVAAPAPAAAQAAPAAPPSYAPVPPAAMPAHPVGPPPSAPPRSAPPASAPPAGPPPSAAPASPPPAAPPSSPPAGALGAAVPMPAPIAPAGPAVEGTAAPSTAGDGAPPLRAVPPLPAGSGHEPVGPFTVVPPSLFTEHLDDGPGSPVER